MRIGELDLVGAITLVSQYLHSSIACIHAITATSGDILVGHFEVPFYLSAETEKPRTYSLRSVAPNLKSTGGFYEHSRVGLASGACVLLSALQHRAGNTSGSHEASVCRHTLSLRVVLVICAAVASLLLVLPSFVKSLTRMILPASVVLMVIAGGEALFMFVQHQSSVATVRGVLFVMALVLVLIRWRVAPRSASAP